MGGQAFLDLGMEHVKELYKNAPKLKEKHNNDTLRNIKEGLQKAGKTIETGFQGVSDWFQNMTDGSKSEPPTAPLRKYAADIKVEAGSTAGSSPWPLIACCSAFAFVGFGVSTACARRQGSAWGALWRRPRLIWRQTLKNKDRLAMKLVAAMSHQPATETNVSERAASLDPFYSL